MRVPLLFVISAPRSGSTMLERMLESHSKILGGPEPHLLTPLAHLGLWANVDKAAYDHVLAAEAQKLFVQKLPEGEQDYWDACRAYCDVLYGRLLASSGKEICLDKTPAYALILPFLMKVFPDAKYVVLTRHPLATFSSYANSFFDGDYAQAQNYNPILNRYVPAMAEFLRQDAVGHFHVRYEDLVKDPETWMGKMYEYIGVPFERETIDYGGNDSGGKREGLGDPIGVAQHARPQTGSIKKWVSELAHSPDKMSLMREVIASINPNDLAAIGYPIESLWKPLEEAGENVRPPKGSKLTRYRVQRKLIVGLRSWARKGGLFRKLLEKARLACNVLLRD
ncbi:MAG TPA: sulfotransferase [Candidatus Hydrogenedentes bacterium]|nr:sulfotransferase [Candidatus Hydrogenedentota bacterium]HQE82040.1 sulfotransferase [Candidatus Hydrogenedentota bacterium]HQH53118.1 sulfotransferase [Candidatus Hydrogenedentota bacterium]HQM47503.1 sulfotransferase [Candidatus Hydrogenedentota bacterium]